MTRRYGQRYAVGRYWRGQCQKSSYQSCTPGDRRGNSYRRWRWCTSDTWERGKDPRIQDIIIVSTTIQGQIPGGILNVNQKHIVRVGGIHNSYKNMFLKQVSFFSVKNLEWRPPSPLSPYLLINQFREYLSMQILQYVQYYLMSQGAILIDQLKFQNQQLRTTVKSLQQEIQERCQNYMMEITYLRTQNKKQHPTNKSLQGSRVNGFSSSQSLSRVIPTQTDTTGVQTQPWIHAENGIREHNQQQSSLDSSPHSKLKQNIQLEPPKELQEQMYQRERELLKQIEELRKEFQQDLREMKQKHEQQRQVKNEQINSLLEQIKEQSERREEGESSEIAELKRKIKEQQNKIERQHSQYQLTVNQFKKMEPSIQKSKIDSDTTQKINKIINCLKKGLGMKMNAKSSKEDEILERKSYSSEKILYKLKRRMEYVVVVHELYKGMIKYILDVATGEKLEAQPKIKEEFEEVYGELETEIERLEQNLFTTEILKESLVSEKEHLERKLKNNEKIFKKLSISDDNDTSIVYSHSEKERDRDRDRETPLSNSKISSTPKNFKTPQRNDNLQSSQVRSLNSSNVKLRVELTKGHYMMMDNRKTLCQNCKQNREYFNEEISKMLEEKDHKIEELEEKYQKLLDEKIVVTPSVGKCGKRDVVLVEEIDIPVSGDESKYVKRHVIRTSSKPKMSQQVILSLSRSKKNVYSSLVNNMENIQEAIETLRREKSEKSLEKMGKLQRINEKIEKLAVKFSPCKRITERLSDLDEDDGERRSKGKNVEYQRENRFSNGRK